MANKYDKILGEYREFDGIVVSDTEPDVGKDGFMYANTTTDKLYIYYAGTWQELHTLVAPTAGTIVIGNPIGLLLSLTYTV